MREGPVRRTPNGKRLGYKYPASVARIKMLCVLGDHPGLTASVLAALFWPHLRATSKQMQPARLAAQHLCTLVDEGLARKQILPHNYRQLSTPPRVTYFLTGLGYEMYEYWQRQQST